LNPKDLEDYSEESKVVYHENEWKLEVKKIWMRFNEVHRKWEKEKTETEFRPITEHYPSLHKKMKGKLIIRRTATDYNTLLPIYGFFVQEIEVSAIGEHQFINYYQGKYYLHDLDYNVSQQISGNDGRYIKRIGEPKRLTDKELKELLKQNIDVYSENNNQLVRELN